MSCCNEEDDEGRFLGFVVVLLLLLLGIGLKVPCIFCDIVGVL